MLDPTSRVAIIVVSGLCVTASLLWSPARAHELGDNAGSIQLSAVLPPIVDRLSAAPIIRDPFTPPAAVSAPTAPPPDESARVATAGRPVEALPSNLSSDAIPAVPGSSAAMSAGAIRVTAIVTGTHPYALVEIGGVHEIKGVGDRISGTPIATIELSGIVLQNGERFAVDAATHS